MSGQNPGETKVLTSLLGKKGSLGPRVPVNWHVQMSHRREALLVELLLDVSAGSDHWFTCCDPVLKLCQGGFSKEVFFRVGVEQLAVIG
jgi:hypothetical protein